MAARRLSPLDHQRINTGVQEMLQKDIIEPSSNVWVSKTHLVRKDDGTFRFCIDLWSLNKITKHDSYPLPCIDDLIDQLGKSKYFTPLDLASGYWQYPCDPKINTRQLLEHNTTYTNSRACLWMIIYAGNTFQRMASTICQDLIHEGVILVYLDDIMIHIAKWSQHIQSNVYFLVRYKI